MNLKNFIATGIVGGIADFLLGWLLYGILFKDYFPGEMPNMVFIFLGCLMFGFLIAYALVRWANLVKFMSGMQGGAVIGLLTGLMNNFFMRSNSMTVDYKNLALDVAITIVMGAISGGIITAMNGAMTKRPV